MSIRGPDPSKTPKWTILEVWRTSDPEWETNGNGEFSVHAPGGHSKGMYSHRISIWALECWGCGTGHRGVLGGDPGCHRTPKSMTCQISGSRPPESRYRAGGHLAPRSTRALEIAYCCVMYMCPYGHHCTHYVHAIADMSSVSSPGSHPIPGVWDPDPGMVESGPRDAIPPKWPNPTHLAGGTRYHQE